MGCPIVTPAKASENSQTSLRKDSYGKYEKISPRQTQDDSTNIQPAKQLDEEQRFEVAMQDISGPVVNENSEHSYHDDSSVSFVVSVIVNGEEEQDSSSNRKSNTIENTNVKNPVEKNVKAIANVQSESLKQRIERVSNKKKKSVGEINASSDSRSSLSIIDSKEKKKSIRELNTSASSRSSPIIVDSKKTKTSIRGMNTSSNSRSSPSLINSKKMKKSTRKPNASAISKSSPSIIDSKKKKNSARELNASANSKSDPNIIDVRKKKKSVRAKTERNNGYAFYYSDTNRKKREENNKKISTLHDKNVILHSTPDHQKVDSMTTNISMLTEKRVPDNTGEDLNDMGGDDTRIPYYEQKCSTPVLSHPFLNFEEKIDSDVEQTIITDSPLVVNNPSLKARKCDSTKQNEKIQQDKLTTLPLSETSQNQGHQEETKKEFQNDFFVVPKNSKEEDDLELVQISSVENECSINLPEMKTRMGSGLHFDHGIKTTGTKNINNPSTASPRQSEKKVIGKLRHVKKSFGAIIAMLEQKNKDGIKWNSQNNKELISQELIMMEQYKELGSLLQLYEETEDVEKMQELAVILDRKYENLNQLFFQYQTMFADGDESSMMVDFNGLADEPLVDEPSSALVYESGKPHLLFDTSLFYQKNKKQTNSFRKSYNNTSSPRICAPYQSKFFSTEDDDDDDVDCSSMLLDICEHANSPLFDGF